MSDLTRDETPERILMEAMLSDNPSDAILAQEARGQALLAASSLLPTKLLDCDRADIEAMGVILGEPLADDPLFMPAELPEGWSLEPSDHSMWSYVVDDAGAKRIAVFYKAAFYDRKAHMSLGQVRGGTP